MLRRRKAGGFEDLKELLAGPPSAERDEMLEWAGDDYDPARFDLAAADAAVAPQGGTIGTSPTPRTP